MNLSLELAVDFVEHLETNQLLANLKLVAVFEKTGVDALAVEQSAVGRVEIAQTVSSLAGFFIPLAVDASMQSRRARIVDPNVRVERPPKRHLFTIERNLHSQQLATQKDQRRPQIRSALVISRERVDLARLITQRGVVRFICHACAGPSTQVKAFDNAVS